MWFRRNRESEVAPAEPADRRDPVRWCITCRTGSGPFVYLENGKHYCRSCADEAGAVMRLRPGGRRTDDVTGT